MVVRSLSHCRPQPSSGVSDTPRPTNGSGEGYERRYISSVASRGRGGPRPMLRLLKLHARAIRSVEDVPAVLEPVIAAARRGLDLDRPVLECAHAFGFDSLMYGICLDPRPSAKSRQFVYTSLSDAWVQRYSACDYIDIDPRVRQVAKTSLPVVWDQSTWRGHSVDIDRFLDDCLTTGVASGISLPIRDIGNRPTLLALSSATRVNSQERLRVIMKDMAAVLLFAQYLHEVVMLPSVEKIVGQREPIPTLSRRECECLSLGARGFGSADIATCMSITPRTVQMYFDNARTKLGASNRQEAVALAIKHGLIIP